MSIIPKLWEARIAQGTEEFWVPAVLAAASAGTQYVNQQNANSKQQAGEVQTILDQQKLQQQANGGVKALTQSIANDSPNTIANQATGAYVSQLRKNAAGTASGGSGGSSILFGAPTSSLPTNIKGSSRYGADTAASQSQVEDYGNQLAGEMGQIDAATRQRQNEGLAAGTLATTLNGLGAQSYTQNFVDQLKANVAGQSSPWLTLLSGALGGAGNTLSKNMAPSATPSAGTSFTGDGSVNGGYGLPGSGATAPSVNPWFDTSGQTNG
jgi:hypothetical protein